MEVSIGDGMNQRKTGKNGGARKEGMMEIGMREGETKERREWGGREGLPKIGREEGRV